MRARTVSEETVGDGAIMTSGSPSKVSSQSICRWIRMDWKHLSRTQVRLRLTNQRAHLHLRNIEHLNEY